MTYTIVQKFLVFVIRLFIAPLWLLDSASQLTAGKKYLKVSVAILFVGMGMLFLWPNKNQQNLPNGFSSKIATLHTGIVSEIYGTQVSTQSIPSNTNVLGTTQTSVSRPVLINKKAFPFITAKAHLVIDNKTKKIFSEHNTDITFAPASTTKLMTALVAIDLYKENDVVTATQQCAATESTKLYLPPGTSYEVKDLMYGLLVNSAGDAGCILATSKVSQEEFVDLMNKKAKEIGLQNTNFTNPVGLDGANGSNYSTVSDLYTLSNRVMQNNILRNVVKTKNYTFNDVSGEVTVNLENTNKLLWQIPETIGVKTGRTSGAGEVLIYRYEDGEKDLTIIVMSSEDRFSDTKELLKWTLSSYKWM